MDTQTAFGLGMAAVIAIGMLIAVAVGMVKLSHLEKKSEESRTNMTRTIDMLEWKLDEAHKEINNMMRKQSEYTENRVSELDVSLHKRIDDIQSVVDSRFDKLDNKISKQLSKN